MVNGRHLYSTFQTSGHSKRFTILLTFTHSCTHSHTDGGVSHARRQSARREQLGCGVSLRDTDTRLDTRLWGAKDRTSNLTVTSQPTLPPEPHAPRTNAPTFRSGSQRVGALTWRRWACALIRMLYSRALQVLCCLWRGVTEQGFQG